MKNLWEKEKVAKEGIFFPPFRIHKPPNSIFLRSKEIRLKMSFSSSSSKSILDFFKQPAAKRLKTTLSSPAKLTKVSVIPDAFLSSSSVNENNQSQEDAACNKPVNTLTVEEKSRIQLNKAIARAKRNLKLCSEKISKCNPSGLFICVRVWYLRDFMNVYFFKALSFFILLFMFMC